MHENAGHKDHNMNLKKLKFLDFWENGELKSSLTIEGTQKLKVLVTCTGDWEFCLHVVSSGLQDNLGGLP